MRQWLIWVAAMLVIAAMIAVNAGTAISSPVAGGPKAEAKAPPCVVTGTCSTEQPPPKAAPPPPPPPK